LSTQYFIKDIMLKHVSVRTASFSGHNICTNIYCETVVAKMLICKNLLYFNSF